MTTKESIVSNSIFSGPHCISREGKLRRSSPGTQIQPIKL